jgi:ankyrin repeat protein
MEYYNFTYIPEKINHYEKLLYKAIHNNNLKQAEFLLQLKVNPNAIIYGYPLLIIAILNNNLSLVNLLLDYKADPNLANLALNTTLIYTPLYVAVWFGNYEIVLTLVEHGANLDENHVDNFGVKLLHTAVIYG